MRPLLVLATLLLSGCATTIPQTPEAPAAANIGVILRDHGEFQHYNASTFQTLRELVDAFWPYTNAPPELLQIDAGTWYIDAAQPWNDEPHIPGDLRDAWTMQGPRAAIPVRDAMNLSMIPHELELDHLVYFSPVGNGNGMGDLYELFGLAVYRKYLLMDNHSPFWSHTAPYWEFIQEELEARGITVAFAHSEDAHIVPKHTFNGAAQAMVEAGVTTVVSVYQGALGSDFDACIKRPELEHALRAAGFKGTIQHHEGHLALDTRWADGSARATAARIASLPGDWRVSIMDVHHGFPPNGRSLCHDRHDPYHDAAREASDLFRSRLRHHLDRDVEVMTVYNEFAHDRGDEYVSPDEALERLLPDHEAIIVVSPYFMGDGMDLLITLRESLGFERVKAPYHDARYESQLTRDGTLVWVLSSDHAQADRKAVLLDKIMTILESA